MDFPPSVTRGFADRRGSVLHTNAGTLINVDHGKFILILKNIEGEVGYCVINSDRYSFDPESKVEIDAKDQPVITKDDCPALSKPKSYVNCANVGIIGETELKAKIDSKEFQYVGSVNAETMLVILAKGQACDVLKPFQKRFFEP